MPKAKYTLEGLEAVRKERKLTTNEYASWWRMRNKKDNTEAYQRWAENHKKQTDKWDANNKEKRNTWQKERYAKKKAIKDAERAAYAVSPEGIAEAEAKEEARKKKNRERMAQWRTDNLEKAREVERASAKRNRENRLKQTAAWRENNKEHVQEYQKAYDEKVRDSKCEKRRAEYAADPEAARKIRRDWAAANPEQAKRNSRAAKARRRAAKAAAGGTHTIAEAAALFAAQNARCANPYCCTEIALQTAHLDHIYPLVPRRGGRQGSNGIENLQWLCQPCNQRKTNLDPAEWARREARRAGLF